MVTMNQQRKRIMLGIVVLTILLASFIIAVEIFYLHTTNESINTSGDINSATTWTTERSPYNMTGNITVVDGVQLTIQASVTVNFNGYTMQVDGTLDAIGNSYANITFNDAQIIFSQSSKGWNQQTNSGCIIENSIFNRSQIVIISSSPKLNNNLFSDMQKGASTILIDGGSPIISDNVITNNLHPDAYGYYGGTDIEIKNGNNATIIGNTINDSMNGILVDPIIEGFSFGSLSGMTTIENNLITNNMAQGITVGAPFPLIIKGNTIKDNYVGLGISAYSNKSILTDNNIYDNTNKSISMVKSQWQPTDVNATYNWWGTTDQQAISQTIYDFKNDSNLGTVNFIPFLTAPNS